jgi:NADH-quinone oxidoreductase subunit C
MAEANNEPAAAADASAEDAPADDDAAANAVAEPAEPEPETMHGAPVGYSLDQKVLFPSREQLIDVVKALHDEGYLMCVDVTAVDYLTYGRHSAAEGDVVYTPRILPDEVVPERFEVVYHLLAHRSRSRLRLRVQVPEHDTTVPTLFGFYPGTEAMEREVFDMFGLSFEGHPDLTRILMPEDWIGHPLRKDYQSGRIPVQFKAAPGSR